MGLADGVARERDYGAPERRTVAGQQSEADWTKECTEKISNAIGGGSELFVRHGEGFRLDVDFVCKRIVEMRERHHDAKRSYVLTARQAEALERENAELREALKPFADVADLVDAETEGVSDDDEFQMHFHDYLMASWKLSIFRRARALLGGSDAGN